jgi:hypothetical protein
MKLQPAFILFFITNMAVLAKPAELKYPVSEIPSELKENVDVVIRQDKMIYKILAKNRSAHYVHYVVTIFNEHGNRYATQSVGYDKLSKINEFNGYAYDANGKQIKKLKNNEIYDRAAFDGYSLYSDNRVKTASLEQGTYPYTVEFEYEVEFKFLFSIPSSYFGGEKSSTQLAHYQIIFPKDFTPTYKVVNMPDNPKKETLADGNQSITWIFENIRPIKFELIGPDPEEITPKIIAAPSTFEYEGFEGDMNSWKEFGKWQLLLNKGRDILPEATKQKVKDLIKGKSSIEDKTRAIYEFLQSKTRYVSISEGIGGLQPFPASTVDQNGYGDCKALSNYMVSMLKEAGIKAYYTKIRAGEFERQIMLDLPSQQTNHVIVSVPNGKDTLWLECTSQTNPFGYQGSFTEDRWALMITEEGGKLVRTINYTPEQNLQSRTAEISLDATGNAKAKVVTTYKGIQYESGGLSSVLHNTDNQKKWVENNTDIPNFSINSFSMTEKKDKIPSASVKLDLTLSRYATLSGKRLFIAPNLMNKTSYVPEKIADRKTDVVRKSNYVDLDTINFSVPENLYPEFLPEPVKIKSKFGEYEANFKFDAGKVTYTRRIKVWKGRFPKETYSELVDFYKNVSKADNIKLVFLNKT